MCVCVCVCVLVCVCLCVNQNGMVFFCLGVVFIVCSEIVYMAYGATLFYYIFSANIFLNYISMLLTGNKLYISGT